MMSQLYYTLGIILFTLILINLIGEYISQWKSKRSYDKRYNKDRKRND